MTGYPRVELTPRSLAAVGVCALAVARFGVFGLIVPAGLGAALWLARPVIGVSTLTVLVVALSRQPSTAVATLVSVALLLLSPVILTKRGAQSQQTYLTVAAVCASITVGGVVVATGQVWPAVVLAVAELGVAAVAVVWFTVQR